MSVRKLQDLLNTNLSAPREPPKFPSFANRSFPHAQQAYYQPSNNIGKLKPQPYLSLLGGMPLINPTYKNMPMHQNLFYHPLVKAEDNSHPSPMVNLHAFSGARESNPVFYAQGNVRQEVLVNNFGSNRNHELINSLASLLQGSHNSASPQPRNLNELLQKSFSSNNSNSILQSPFMSSHHSQFAGYNPTQSSYVQNIMAPDYSNLLTASVLETPIQNSNMFRNPMIQQSAPQSAENMNEALLLKLARLLKQDNGENIKTALSDILHGYDTVNIPAQDRQRDLAYQRRPQGDFGQSFHQQSNLNIGQKTISLSNGVVMNSLNRNNECYQTNNRFAPVFVNNGSENANAKRDMVVLSDPSLKKGNNYSIIPEEDSTMLCDVSFSGAKAGSVSMNVQPSSPHQNLNTKLNSLNINASTQDKPNNVSFSLNALPIDQELSNILDERIQHDTEPPGTYTREERTNKILKYKNKIRKWRNEHPVNRNFKGRSAVAGKKPRIKGKFVTTEEYVKYVETTNQKGDYYEHDSQANDHFNENSTYVGSEKSAREHDLTLKEEAF